MVMLLIKKQAREQTKVRCGGRKRAEKDVNNNFKLHQYNKLKQISTNNV